MEADEVYEVMDAEFSYGPDLFPTTRTATPGPQGAVITEDIDSVVFNFHGLGDNNRRKFHHGAAVMTPRECECGRYVGRIRLSFGSSRADKTRSIASRTPTTNSSLRSCANASAYGQVLRASMPGRMCN